jgi:hypothetical protein
LEKYDDLGKASANPINRNGISWATAWSVTADGDIPARGSGLGAAGWSADPA